MDSSMASPIFCVYMVMLELIFKDMCISFACFGSVRKI